MFKDELTFLRSYFGAGLVRMGNVVTLSSKFQISIPKQVRESQGWKAGQKLAFISDSSGVSLVAVPTINDLRGIAKGANTENYRDRNDRY